MYICKNLFILKGVNCNLINDFDFDKAILRNLTFLNLKHEQNKKKSCYQKT